MSNHKFKLYKNKLKSSLYFGVVNLICSHNTNISNFSIQTEVFLNILDGDSATLRWGYKVKFSEFSKIRHA